MRRFAVLTAVLAAVLTGGAGAALAGPELPKVPQDCHDWNELLGIDNVRDCSGS